MLVLSRKRNESVKIGDDVTVTIVDIRGDKVRLGFTAPRGVSVHRREIWDSIQRTGEEKARGRVGDAGTRGKTVFISPPHPVSASLSSPRLPITTGGVR